MRMSQPTPELPVPNVRKAQEYYRDTLGFEVAWYNEPGKIGAVSSGDCTIFFREATKESPSSTFWVYCEELNEAYDAFLQRGANLTEEPTLKPWGLRQFTVQDHCGNKFYFFHDV